MLALLSLLFLLLAPAQAAGETTSGDVPSVQDYRVVERLGNEALASGDKAGARVHFEHMFELQEVRRYLPYRDGLKEALVLERLGHMDQAAEAYRESFSNDALRTVHILRILSIHPDRDALVDETVAYVREAVAAAEAGESGVIYTTAKGTPKRLKPMTQDEVIERIEAGKSAKYCYVESLDFTELDDELLATSDIVLNRCVIGSMTAQTKHFQKLAVKAFILGDVQLGKQWSGEKNKSTTIRSSTFDVLNFRESVILGEANFAGVETGEKTTGFQMTVFEGPVDFKGAELHGPADLRFAAFQQGGNFKDARLHHSVYFGGTRYAGDVVFTGVSSDRFVYFNSATFDGAARFDKCEWRKGATFEDSRFGGPASLETTRIDGRLNMSRVVFEQTLSVKEVHTQGLDMVGTHFRGNASFVDARFDGKVRFSLDDVTRAQHLTDTTPLLALYRDYQGDEDADEPLATTASYGVETVDDLIARIDKSISFANTTFTGYAVFERVTFGTPGEKNVAQFYNTQFLGESHFERATWHAAADFTTIFGNEIAFNESIFHDTLILDDANVPGRVILTDAEFVGDADWSWYAAEVRTFQVYADQLHSDDGHRLFYEKCATDRGDAWRTDERVVRLTRGRDLTEDEIRAACYDAVIDEFVGLKDSFGDRAMIDDEDDAYWWTRHHETMARIQFGSIWDRIIGVADIFLFEWCFGWGVQLGNLFACTFLVTALFAWIYRRFCPDTMLMYHGRDIAIRDVSFAALFFVSFQSLLAINTGWDFGEDDHRFRYLNSIQTLIGFIILTFFVGAYTRMILA
ncbi:MAG: hypothetical protein GY913_27935 [Proteobacteria bacterium]|nr:hypothetical protein [Pseudomonadota bacterium]MCP4920741.1 hypothetical protein [Pseudomonadota bacterium]